MTFVNPKTGLPRRLPEKWEDYHAFQRPGGGLRASLHSVMEERQKSVADAAEYMLTALTARGEKKLSVTALRSRLSRFLRGEADLTPAQFAAFAGFLNLGPAELAARAKEPAPFELHRSEWRLDAGAKKVAALTAGAQMNIHRLVRHPSRGIDAYIRSGFPAAPEHRGGPPPEYHVSPGYSFAYVLSGNVRANFFELPDEELRGGDAISYDMRHAHTFTSATAQRDETTLLLDVAATPEGVARELFLKRFEVHDLGELTELEKVRRYSVSMALSACRMPITELAAVSTISRKRLASLQTCKETATRAELEELSYLLRRPVSTFYRPLGRESRPDIYQVIRAERLEDGVSDIRVSSPSLYPGEGLRVEMFTPEGPTDPQHQANQPRDHHVDDPGEELIFVLAGSLGVSLRARGTSDAPCTGVLRERDSIWYSTALAHSLYPVGEGGAPRCLRFRLPYPRT